MKKNFINRTLQISVLIVVQLLVGACQSLATKTTASTSGNQETSETRTPSRTTVGDDRAIQRR